MTGRYQVWMNDRALTEIDPDIVITDILYTPIQRAFATTQFTARHGSLPGRDFIAENRVSVSFMIRKYATDERQTVCQAINNWCYNGGWLKVSDRPGQRMYVECTKPPVLPSVLRWLDVITVEFCAFVYPFWEDETPKTVELDAGDEGSVYMMCALDTEAEATITAGEALTSVTLTCGDTSITLAALSIAAGATITIRYTEKDRILEIKSGNTDLMTYRTSASSDDLIAKPGANALAFTASGAASCVFSFRGAYL